MQKYCIWIVSPAGYPHSHVFDEPAICYQAAFAELGYSVPIVTDHRKISGRPIVLGCHLLPKVTGWELPEDAILYNLEQVSPGSPQMRDGYVNLLKKYTVWDYSQANIREWKQFGVENVIYAGMGYSKMLTHIPEVSKDIDVFFYGSLCERRMKVINSLREKGVNAVALFNVYGKQRDQAIARSKIQLNMHLYASKVLEIQRVMYLLANKAFVISETGTDQELEKPFEGGMVFAEYDQMVDACMEYLNKSAKRQSISSAGFFKVRGMRQADMLKETLARMN